QYMNDIKLNNNYNNIAGLLGVLISTGWLLSLKCPYNLPQKFIEHLLNINLRGNKSNEENVNQCASSRRDAYCHS
ncbi:hypothetical protein, partial [Fangia hongkongensis]|uniref:hypothetical protein n=1 Tax=Fangia hongkongensis TaxID=270495 RepID=UPI001F46C8E3